MISAIFFSHIIIKFKKSENTTLFHKDPIVVLFVIYLKKHSLNIIYSMLLILLISFRMEGRKTKVHFLNGSIKFRLLLWFVNLLPKQMSFHFRVVCQKVPHSTYKSEFLQKKHSLNADQHFQHLDEFMDYCNHQRYPYEHYGLTPHEVLDGKTPCKFRYREQIKNSQKERLEENRVFNGCPTLYFQ